MANTVTYETQDGLWTFRFPTVIVTKAAVTSAWGYARVSTRYTYTVRSVLVAVSAADLKTKEDEAHRILMAPRGTFKWSAGGTDLVSWGPYEDCNFGPHPSALTFDRIFGVNAVMMTWQLELEVASVDSEVMDITYQMSHALNKSMYTVRTITGMMRLNGAKFSPTSFTGADAYRNTVDKFVCSVPKSWQRVVFDVQASTNGLELAFHIVDEQLYAALPPNVVEGDAALSVEGNPRQTKRKDFILSGFFESAPDAPEAAQNAFVELATALFSYKIENETFRVKHLALQQSLYRPRLQFTMAWDAFPPDPLDPVPGDTETEKNANFMLSLMSKANDWINKYKNEMCAYRGPYGTTDVLGWCGSGAKAPIVPVSGYLTDRMNSADPNSNLPAPVQNQFQEKTSEGYFYRFEQHYKYTTDYHIRAISKKDDVDDVFQQVKNPQTYLMVWGRIISHNKTAILPEPPYDNTRAVLLLSETTLDEPKAGPEYETTWKYLMRRKTKGKPETLKIPYSPNVDPTIFDATDDPTGTKWPGKAFTNYTFENDIKKTVP